MIKGMNRETEIDDDDGGGGGGDVASPGVFTFKK